jgi:hypothetical protein
MLRNIFAFEPTCAFLLIPIAGPRGLVSFEGSPVQTRSGSFSKKKRLDRLKNFTRQSGRRNKHYSSTLIVIERSARCLETRASVISAWPHRFRVSAPGQARVLQAYSAAIYSTYCTLNCSNSKSSCVADEA